MSSRPMAAVRETMVKSNPGKMWRKLKAGWKVECFYAKRTAVRWCSQLICTELLKERKPYKKWQFVTEIDLKLDKDMDERLIKAEETSLLQTWWTGCLWSVDLCVSTFTQTFSVKYDSIALSEQISTEHIRKIWESAKTLPTSQNYNR